MVARAWDMAVTPLQGWGGYWDRFTWAFSPGYNIVGLRPWKRLRSFLDARLVGFDSHIRVCTDLSLEKRAQGPECDSPGWSGAKARVTRSKEYLQAGKAVALGHCLTRLLPLAPRCWVDERAEADKNAGAPFAHIANIHKNLRCAPLTSSWRFAFANGWAVPLLSHEMNRNRPIVRFVIGRWASHKKRC